MSDEPRRRPLAGWTDFIAEEASLVRVQCELIERYCALGDVPGLNYAVRGLAARTRAIVDTTADLNNELRNASGDRAS